MKEEKINKVVWLSSFINDLEGALKSEALTDMNMEDELNDMIIRAKKTMMKKLDELEKDDLRDLLKTGWIKPQYLSGDAFLRTRFFERGWLWG